MKLLKHAQHIVVVHDAHRTDLVDPLTGRWQSYTTPRAAKWWASVRRRVEEGFGGVALADDIRVAQYMQSLNHSKE